MSGWLLVILLFLAGAAVGALLVAARSAPRARASDAALEDAETRLEQRERTSAAQDEVRDVILSSMEDGVLLVDPEGRTAFANGALASLLGARPERTSALFPLALREVVDATLRDGEGRSALAEVGSPARWIRVLTAPAGTDGSVLAVVRDVTEARRLEDVRRDFVTNASHELKTPAASIRATAETLVDASADDPAAVARFSAQLHREAIRLTNIVADLLDLSRLESGTTAVEEVDLAAVALEETRRLEEQAASAGLTLTCRRQGGTVVVGSYGEMGLMVRNLVDNAIRCTAAGGRVTVTADREAGEVVLRVTDTGIGIPTRDIPRVFERFYRVDRARSRETGGTGLGLAIVKHVAENHGGTVDLQSELGSGSTFEVRLPAAAPGVAT